MPGGLCLLLANDYPPSARSFSYMVDIELIKSTLHAFVEENQIRIEVIRRSKNDPVSTESY